MREEGSCLVNLPEGRPRSPSRGGGPTGDFYRATRATLEGAWVRPRHDGYMAFQQQASDRINEGLTGRQDAGQVVADINRLFRESFAPAAAG